MFSTLQELTSLLDATLLRPDAGDEEVAELARQALRLGCAAVCVMPARLTAASRMLAGGHVALAAAISFPHGATTTAGKIREAGEALALGATELDVVCDLAAVRQGDVPALEREMAAIMDATPDAIHKFILEVAWLPEQAWPELGRALGRLGPAFAKTGTGVHGGPVTAAQVRRLREVCRGGVAVKAAGGIRTLESARALVAAGASRLGTSAAGALAAALTGRP